MDGAIQQEEIYKELVERLREELDYGREAAQMRLYGLMLGNDPTVHVPVPFAGFCTKRLLTMTWLDGGPLMRRLEEDPPQEERNRIAEALFRAWYVPLYRYGVIHGDPHLGNYQVRPDGTVNLLDFGAIRVFPAKFVRGVIDLYRSGARQRRRQGAPRLHHLGLHRSVAREDGGAEPVGAVPVRAADARTGCAASRKPTIRNIGREVAERVHAGLKRTGGVKPPREFVLMDRSAIGLGGVFLRLGAELNWSRLFHDLIADFDSDALAARQAAALAQAGVPPSS